MSARYVLVLPVVLLLYTGCSIGSVVVNVKSDGSGTMELRMLQVDQVDEQPEVKGASEKRNTKYTLERLSYEFDQLSNLSLDDLTFDLRREEGSSTISMTIPVTKKSGWVRQMKLSKERMEKLKKRFEKMTERSDRRALQNIDPEDALKVKFQLNVPAEIEEYEVDAPELEDHEWVSEKTVQNDDPANNQLVIDVPVRAIFQQDLKNISVEVSFESRTTGSDEEENDDGKDGESEGVKTY